MTENNNLKFIKQISQNLCNRLTRTTKKDDDVIFIKQVPQHLRDIIAQKTKKDNDVAFVKPVPQHPHCRLKQKLKNTQQLKKKKKQIVAPKAKTAKNNLKIAKENPDLLEKGIFNLKKY